MVYTTQSAPAQPSQPSSRGLIHHGDLVVGEAVELVDDLAYQPVGSSSPFAPSRLRVSKVDSIVYQPVGLLDPRQKGPQGDRRVVVLRAPGLARRGLGRLVGEAPVSALDLLQDGQRSRVPRRARSEI